MSDQLLPLVASTLALMIPIIAILAVAALIFIKIYFSYKRRKEMFTQYHQERMAAIDKGIDLPPLPGGFFGENTVSRTSPKSHLLKGMILLFVGIALLFALDSLKGLPPFGENLALFGLIPAGIGLAHLIYYFVAGRKDIEAMKNAAPPVIRQQQPKSE